MCHYFGCTDSVRMNYDPSATKDSGLCMPRFLGCTDSFADNYSPEFNVDDGACEEGGCTDPTDGNYNARATFNDGTCITSAASRRKLQRSETSGCMAPMVRRGGAV
jgi:hypothetical protein